LAARTTLHKKTTKKTKTNHYFNFPEELSQQLARLQRYSAE